MKKNKLSRLIDINSTILRNADGDIARSLENLESEKNKLIQLQDYKSTYVDGLRQRINGMTSSVVLKQFVDFIAELDKTIEIQTNNITILKKNIERQLADRDSLKRKHKPVEIVSQKIDQHLKRKSLARQENEQEDHCASRYRYTHWQE